MLAADQVINKAFKIIRISLSASPYNAFVHLTHKNGGSHKFNYWFGRPATQWHCQLVLFPVCVVPPLPPWAVLFSLPASPLRQSSFTITTIHFGNWLQWLPLQLLKCSDPCRFFVRVLVKILMFFALNLNSNVKSVSGCEWLWIVCCQLSTFLWHGLLLLNCAVITIL